LKYRTLSVSFVAILFLVDPVDDNTARNGQFDRLQRLLNFVTQKITYA